MSGAYTLGDHSFESRLIIGTGKYESFEQKLTKVYGNNKSYDFLMPDSIWDEPKDFMMGLLRNERHKAALWNSAANSKLTDSLTEIGLALIALGVVLQVIFGATVPFIGLDIVGSVLALVSKLGGEGLVGLAAIWVLWGIYDKK